MSERCRATTKAGKPCTVPVVAGWDYCRFHHPDASAMNREAGVKGGHAKSNAARARKRFVADALTPKELEGVIGRAIRDVLGGELPPAVGASVASLARAAVAIREASEFEERLGALEARPDPGAALDPERLTPAERETYRELRAKMAGEPEPWDFLPVA